MTTALKSYLESVKERNNDTRYSAPSSTDIDTLVRIVEEYDSYWGSMANFIPDWHLKNLREKVAKIVGGE